MSEMTTFFLWVWRVKRDSGRGLNFSLKFGLALFYDFLNLIYGFFFFSKIKYQKFSMGIFFFFFLEFVHNTTKAQENT